ncbi:nucleoside phosphorylase [Metabacillus idriensis]|uniref:nucleoside phosphorylase n=1 Tax=Metabacillus idriensis TaxID=324768 RepID=UPI00174B114D|nr:nucleoside phosphorylase [Metabacillus idriensis]
MAVHLKGATCEDIGEVTLLAGDPDRVKLIGYKLQNPRLVTENREFVLISGYWKGKKVSVCSTGIGISSTEIAVIELLEMGAKCLVRLGGCGAWQSNINPGDIIINHAMARDPGTLKSYSVDVFPAVGDPILVNCLRETAVNNNFRVHFGIGLTTQSYYLGQDRKPDISRGPSIENLMKYWSDRSIINCDMETAAIYILASLYGVYAGNLLVAHGNRITDQWVEDEEYQRIHATISEIVFESCFNSLQIYNSMKNTHSQIRK